MRETLSDHRYIRFSVSARTAGDRGLSAPRTDGLRWTRKGLDKVLLEEAAIV